MILVIAAALSITSPKADLSKRLLRVAAAGRLLFGQQNASLFGMSLGGVTVTTDVWFEQTARAGKWTSETAQITGSDPAVLGIGLDLLAFEPPSWNRRDVVGEAARRQLAKGGIVTFDWHAESCEAPFTPQGLAGTVSVDGRDVPIYAKGGGWFYAEDSYRRAITSAADVPATLKCLCKIANDLPISNGPYRGMSAATWLRAHALHTAAVFREQGLGRAPLIIRPFHEQNGDWFWWGRPFWNCAALLGRPDAVSGAAAYKKVVNDFVQTLRAAPGMENLLFAFSPAAAPIEREHLSERELRMEDPAELARDLLRQRLVRELNAAGLAYEEKDRGYLEGYPGDDFVDLLGVDFYFPRWRPANPRDQQKLSRNLAALRAAAHGKPYALTEIGTRRLPLIERIRRAEPGSTVTLSSAEEVTIATALFFDQADRERFLRSLGLEKPAAVVTTAPKLALEDWFNTQLLPAALKAHVAYALVWQTYNASGAASYFVPPVGHPETPGFARFAKTACLLNDSACER